MQEKQSRSLKEALVRLELELLKPEVRASRETLDRLLADHFLEIAATGLRFGKQEALDRLPDEAAPRFTARGFELRHLSPDLGQLVYRATLERPGEDVHHSWRTSLWQRLDGRWQMVYHQGTPSDHGKKQASASSQGK